MIVVIDTHQWSGSCRNTVSGSNGNTVSDCCNRKVYYETRRQPTTPQVHLDLPPNCQLMIVQCAVCTRCILRTSIKSCCSQRKDLPSGTQEICNPEVTVVTKTRLTFLEKFSHWKLTLFKLLAARQYCSLHTTIVFLLHETPIQVRPACVCVLLWGSW